MTSYLKTYFQQIRTKYANISPLNPLTHYSPVLLIYNHWKPKGFMFSGDIDKQHRAVMS